jgi:hypothetical protein
MVLMVGVNFFFAYIAASRLIVGLTVFFLIFLGVMELIRTLKFLTKQKIVSIAILLGLIIVLVLSNDWFFGPKYHENWKYRLNSVEIIDTTDQRNRFVKIDEVFSLKQQCLIAKALDSQEARNPLKSIDLRLNLLYVGLDFIKNKPVTGIGPGQFRNTLQNSKDKYQVGSLSNPHNYVIEVISQYGLVGWAYFILLATIYFYIFRCFILLKKTPIFFFLIWMHVMMVLWLVPSSFLYLEINWIYVPFLILVFEQLNETKNAVKQDVL